MGDELDTQGESAKGFAINVEEKGVSDIVIEQLNIEPRGLCVLDGVELRVRAFVDGAKEVGELDFCGGVEVDQVEGLVLWIGHRRDLHATTKELSVADREIARAQMEDTFFWLSGDALVDGASKLGEGAALDGFE